MVKLKVRAHTCYLGNTGYASHARGFFRSLSKYCDLRIRNFNWDSYNNIKSYINQTDLEILDQITLSTPEGRSDFNIVDVLEFSNIGFINKADSFNQDVDIVLIEPSHYYFFDEYKAKTKIAYTVWESTRLPEFTLDIFEKFDSIWVVSQWHKDCLIEQGISHSKIWIVPEGVDGDFNCDNILPKVDEYLDNRFKFLFFGRWDYRKSVPEIVNAFLEEFSQEEPVDLVLSADNPFSNDGLSTEERLIQLNLMDQRIKVKHFPGRQEYLSYLHNGHVLVTCARSEGWNIPLCEAIAAGIPVIYSNWGAQLEFCRNIGCPVNVVGEVPALYVDDQVQHEIVGNYCLPDYQDLKKVMRYTYLNYFQEKDKSVEYSNILRSKFNWDRIGEIGFEALIQSVAKNTKISILFSDSVDFESNLNYYKSLNIDTLVISNSVDNFESNFVLYQKDKTDIKSRLNIALNFIKNLGYNKCIINISGYNLQFDLNLSNDKILNEFDVKYQEINKVDIFFSFVDGAKVEIKSKKKSKFLVTFVDDSNGDIIFESVLNSNNWCSPNRRYFTDWIIRVKDLSTGEIIFKHKYNADNKRVFICFESSSLGDTIAWLPAVEEFRIKHNCQIFLSTFKNELFEKEYPFINFVQPGSVINDLYALYRIGWYYYDDKIDINKNPIDPKTRPMQATSFDILGIEYNQIKTKITIPNEPNRFNGPYVCIGIHSTAQAKYWNYPGGWQSLVDWFVSIGYKVILISKESGGYMSNVVPNGIIDKSGDLPLSDRIVDLKYAKAFIGIGSGLSWLAWSVGTPTVLISGFSNPSTEFLGSDVLRIFNPESCNSCFNRFMLDPSDWLWCPDHRGTQRHFECTKSISADYVISEIKKFLPNL